MIHRFPPVFILALLPLLAGCVVANMAATSANFLLGPNTIPNRTYCQSATNPGQIYIAPGHTCFAGDRELHSWEYQRAVAEAKNREKKVTAQAQADEMSRLRYCLGDSGMPYRSPAGKCYGADTEISRDEYSRLRDGFASSAAVIPLQAMEKEQARSNERSGSTPQPAAAEIDNPPVKEVIPPSTAQDETTAVLAGMDSSGGSSVLTAPTEETVQPFMEPSEPTAELTKTAEGGGLPQSLAAASPAPAEETVQTSTEASESAAEATETAKSGESSQSLATTIPVAAGSSSGPIIIPNTPSPEAALDAVTDEDLDRCAELGRCEVNWGSDGRLLQIEPVSLSEDGPTAYLLTDMRPPTCTPACNMKLLVKRNGRSVSLLEGQNIWFWYRSKTNGYFDVLLGYKGRGFESEGPFPIYKWDGKTYVPSGVAQIKL